MKRSSQHSASQLAADWTFGLGVDKTWGAMLLGNLLKHIPRALECIEGTTL